MLALVLGFVNGFFLQRVQAHVSVHFAVDQVLIDSGQLASQKLIENVDDCVVALHGVLHRSCRKWAGLRTSAGLPLWRIVGAA